MRAIAFAATLAAFSVWLSDVGPTFRSGARAEARAYISTQRGRQGGTGEKPKVDVVQSVGCAERKAEKPESWWITRAGDPRVVQPGIFSTAQIEAAKSAGLGTNSFQLVGVADFLDAETLLRSGQRKEFTTPENANATGQLREGRKILIKGMLVDATDVKRINLLTVIALADTCG